MDKVKIASHYTPVVFAVSGGWVGSSAVNETGQRWMSAARTTLGLGAAGWMSELVGKSKSSKMVIGTGSFVSTYFGYSRNAIFSCGSLSPDRVSGIYITEVAANTSNGNLLEVHFQENAARTIEVSIPGAGAVRAGRAEYFPATNESVYRLSWGGIYGWLQARNGQTVDVTIRLV